MAAFTSHLLTTAVTQAKRVLAQLFTGPMEDLIGISLLNMYIFEAKSQFLVALCCLQCFIPVSFYLLS